LKGQQRSTDKKATLNSVRVEDNGHTGDKLFITMRDKNGNVFYTAGGTLSQGSIEIDTDD